MRPDHLLHLGFSRSPTADLPGYSPSPRVRVITNDRNPKARLHEVVPFLLVQTSRLTRFFLIASRVTLNERIHCDAEINFWPQDPTRYCPSSARPNASQRPLSRPNAPPLYIQRAWSQSIPTLDSLGIGLPKTVSDLPRATKLEHRFT